MIWTPWRSLKAAMSEGGTALPPITMLRSELSSTGFVSA